MSQNLQNIAKFQKCQLENLVDFEKCCKTHILLQKSEPIQPKTNNILPKFCQPTLSDAALDELDRQAAPDCIRQWFEHQALCPVCREDVGALPDLSTGDEVSNLACITFNFP